MANTTEYVTDSVIESINKHTTIDLSKCENDRKSGHLQHQDILN